MNERQAEALKSVIEAGHPDAGTTVKALPDGAAITISGPLKALAFPGLGASPTLSYALGKTGRS